MTIEYIRLKPKHSTIINEFCVKHKVSPPKDNSVVFGAFENDILIGLGAVKLMYQIEPLITDEGYPRVTQILGEKAMAVVSNIGDEVTALVNGEKVAYIDLLEKYGFVLTDKNMSVLKRRV